MSYILATSPLLRMVISVTLLAAAAPAGDRSGHDRDLAYAWRCYSQRIDYDRGGHGVADASLAAEQLTLHPDGTWSLGSSRGQWSTAAIETTDWKRWGVKPYGPTRKITLANWNGHSADGPLEPDRNRPGWINFFWVIYHVDKPQPAAIQLKYGHVNRDLK